MPMANQSQDTLILQSGGGPNIRRLLSSIWIELAALVAVGVVALVVWPFGEYAILDDWAFVKSLEHLHNEGRVVILDWNPMSLVGHLAYGLVFTKALGFSFWVTKASVVALHAAQCVIMARMLRACDVPSGMILAGLATFIMQPLVVLHAYTYMTDISTTAWTTAAVFCFSKGLPGATRRQLAWLASGSLAAGLAGLVRQPGALAILAFGIHLALFYFERFTVRMLACAFAPGIVMLGIFWWWYHEVHGPTSTFDQSLLQVESYVTGMMWKELPFVGLELGIYLGLFVAPLALAMPWRVYALPNGKGAYLFVVLAAALTCLFAYDVHQRGRLFPYMHNCFTQFGFFPENEFILGERPVLWPSWVPWAFSLAGLVALAVILRVAFGVGESRAPDRGGEAEYRLTRLLVVLLALQLTYLVATTPIQYDRHLLLTCPTAITLFAILVRNVGQVRWIPFCIGLAPFALYGLAATHDIHAISRTAWKAGDELLADGVPADRLDAGYAFTCWHMYERSREADTRPSRTEDAWWIERLTPAVTPRYVVSLSNPIRSTLQPYEVHRAYQYWAFWPWGWRTIWVLEVKR